MEPWEKNTITMAMLTELKKELALMDSQSLDLFTAAVMDEVQKRAPKTLNEIEDAPGISADLQIVTELVDGYIKAFNDRCNDKSKKEVGFISAFMSTTNFVRFIIENIERRQDMPLKMKRSFRMMVVATLERSLMSRVMN